MTIVQAHSQQQTESSGISSPSGQVGRTGRLGNLERETIRRDIAGILAAEARSVRGTYPNSGVMQRLGSATRVLFGLIWLADVYFKWQPSFLNGLLDVMHDGTMGQPSWLMPWFNFNRAVIAVQPTVWAYGIAVVETGIALALLLGFARKVTYVGGAVWSLVIWATAEGLGRTRPGEIATDIGTAIVYTAVFLALLAADQCEGTRPFSVDAVIERRLPWWRRIAEVRR